METRSPIIRLLIAFWLLASQIAGAALVFVPVVVLLAFGEIAANDPNPGAFNMLVVLGFVLPVLFLGLGITAWVMFARRQDVKAALFGLATLVPGGVMLLAMNLVAP